MNEIDNLDYTAHFDHCGTELLNLSVLVYTGTWQYYGQLTPSFYLLRPELLN